MMGRNTQVCTSPFILPLFSFHFPSPLVVLFVIMYHLAAVIAVTEENERKLDILAGLVKLKPTSVPQNSSLWLFS